MTPEIRDETVACGKSNFFTDFRLGLHGTVKIALALADKRACSSVRPELGRVTATMTAVPTTVLVTSSAALPRQVYRPKQGQCVRCTQRGDCKRDDFQAMPVRLIHADGTRIVDCVGFQSCRGKMN